MDSMNLHHSIPEAFIGTVEWPCAALYLDWENYEAFLGKYKHRCRHSSSHRYIPKSVSCLPRGGGAYTAGRCGVFC